MTSINDAAKELSKKIDEITLKALQEKFNTTETDPYKLKKMLDYANLEFDIDRISEEIESDDKFIYTVIISYIPKFRTKKNPL